MKKKLMRMPKVVTILVAVLIVAIFLGSMDVAAFFLADTVSLPGYGSSMIAEFMAGVVAFLLLCLFGYLGVSGRKRKGIYPWSLYWRIPDRILLSGTGGTTLCADDDTGCKSCICIGNPVFCCNHVSDRIGRRNLFSAV